MNERRGIFGAPLAPIEPSTATRYRRPSAFEKEGLVHRVRRSAVVAAVLAAVTLAAIGPAGASEPAPTIKHCFWWPGTTEAHWDRAYLLDHYRTNHVTRVDFHWSGFFNGHESVIPSGDNARATTTISAQEVKATLVLGNGQTVDTNTKACELGH